MRKKVKVWNGGGIRHGTQYSIYVGATTIKQALELLDQGGFPTSRYYFKEYFSPLWGRAMEGVEPEIGLWAVPDRIQYRPGVKPERLI